MSLRMKSLWIVLTVAGLVTSAKSQEAVSPREVKVLPVFFVPKGEFPPTDDHIKRLIRHLEWSQTRYGELLGKQNTFKMADRKPLVYQSKRPLSYYREQPESGVPQVAGELLDELELTRFNCPYILVSVWMNPANDFPVGGGRPLNGGINTGGGIIVLSSFALDRSPNFQSTLQHELGHSFGLPHVDVYKYDMKRNDSLMSYNPTHHTRWFDPSATPGKLNPEDLRALALNHRVFPKLSFDPARDVPAGYKIAEQIVTLGPMKITGQPDGVKVTTTSGEDFNSKVANIVQGRILPSKKVGGKVMFDAGSMWQSRKTGTGWVSAEVTFPYSVGLTQLAVHSQHSGEYHIAQAIKVSVRDGKDGFRKIIESDLKSADDPVSFPKTEGKVWNFEFQTIKGGAVVLRGLQFFSGDDELFPPQLPYQP